MNLLLLWLALAGGPRIDNSPTFDFRGDTSFGDPRRALSTWLANRDHVPRGDQHFCVVGYQTPDWTWAWVHWKEGRMLLLWEGADPDYAAEGLLHSRRQLSFDTDVVPTQEDVGSSTYLVSKPWIAERLDDCAKHGFRFTVRAGKKRP